MTHASRVRAWLSRRDAKYEDMDSDLKRFVEAVPILFREMSRAERMSPSAVRSVDFTDPNPRNGEPKTNNFNSTYWFTNYLWFMKTFRPVVLEYNTWDLIKASQLMEDTCKAHQYYDMTDVLKDTRANGGTMNGTATSPRFTVARC